MFKEQFISALKDSGLNQNELAKRIGITRQTISEYKTGKSQPTLETLCKICDTLDVSADYLLGRKEY